MKNIVPIITPFYDDFSIDFESLSRHSGFLYQNGIREFVVGGTTGESLALNNTECRTMCSALRNLGNDVVLIGCVFKSDWVSIKKSIHAFRDCDHLLVMPPMFIRPSEEDVIDFIEFILSNSHQKIILYNNPTRTKVDISNIYERLCVHERVIGVKETSVDHNPTVPWWCGEDLRVIEAINQTGAVGIISACANILPDIASKIVMKTITIEEEVQWSSCAKLLSAYVNPAAVKHILWKLGVIRTPTMRFAIKLRDTYDLDWQIDAILRA